MNNNSQLKPRLVLLFFIVLVILDWLYTIEVQSISVLINNSWFVVLPLLFYFYFAFAIVALIGLLYRKTLGLVLGYCVLMFGTVMAVVSYNFIYQKQYLIEDLIIPLIALNVCTIFYMAYSHCYYKND